MKKDFEFDKIYVIESLRKGDLKTGSELYNDTIKYGLWKKGLFEHCVLFEPITKSDFFTSIENIKNELRDSSKFPLIHIEMHGFEKGLELTNGEIITWSELQYSLIEINILCKNNLFLIMASCFGGYVYTTIQPVLRTPFWGFIGPFSKVEPKEILFNFKAFYEDFIENLDINKAVEVLNETNEKNVSKFRFHNTEIAFERAYINYEEKYLTEEVIEKRLEMILLEARKDPVMNVVSDEDIKKSSRFHMVENKEYMKFKMMENFFMWDLFPEMKSE